MMTILILWNVVGILCCKQYRRSVVGPLDDEGTKKMDVVVTVVLSFRFMVFFGGNRHPQEK